MDEKNGLSSTNQRAESTERVIDAVVSPTITGSVIRFGSEIENL
jgi:hypothetical protein